MNTHTIKLFIFLFILFQKGHSQNLITGSILDSLTKKPVTGVSITDLNSNNGTVTNEDGEFQIFVNTSPSKLQISHVSYQKKIVLVKNTDFLRINLSIATIQLPEFQTGNPAIAILNAVVRKAVNDTANKHYYKAFYQKVSYFNGKYTKFQQIFMNVSWSQLGVERWQPTNVRYAELSRKKHEAANAIVVSFLNSRVIHKHTNFPLNINNLTNNYRFKIKHYLNAGIADEIVVIECKPSKTNKNMIKFEGEIYVKTATDNLLKIVGDYFYSASKGFHQKSEIEINFKDNKSGFTCFENLRIIDKTVRPLQNYKNQDKLWLYFLYETKDFEYQKSQPAFVDNDKRIIKEVAYNPEYWSQNIPIKQTKIEEEIIKYFEKKGEFKSNF